MEIDKQAVGNRIRQIRQELKLSMEKFGKLIGDLPRSIVNNWERDQPSKNRNPSPNRRDRSCHQ